MNSRLLVAGNREWGESPTAGDVMPKQPRPLPGGRVVHWRAHAWLRRVLFALLVVSQSLLAAWYMAAVLPYHGGNAVEKALIALFTLLFLWISVGFWVGVYGFVLRRFGGDRLSLDRRYTDAELAAAELAPTAIIMPIYHEPIAHTLAGLRAIYRSLQRSGQIEHFQFFILSDSRDPEVWLAEQQAWLALVDELDAGGRLYYRRRTRNVNYKSGNVADFLRRWGQRFEYMLVLDADSLMGGETLARMVRLMQLEPQVGILQSNPTIIDGQSAFARVQQFANQVYGPLFSTGLAALQLGEAAFWGHNAIIRVQPFMRHCGLPRMTGPGLFDGPILSHDFVEAAFIGRAGYEVWLEPGLQHSYEASPPSLTDELSRDRRWAKGNLQHLWLMVAPGLRWAHRMAFLNGIMSYLTAPLWFAFLVLTTVEAAQLVLVPTDYFPDAHSLFPLWPEWRPEWALSLAAATALLLFAPKLLAVVDVLLTRRSRQYGGAPAVTLSVLLEIIVSALLAPIRMLAHTRFVLEALLNLQLSWAGQNRTDETGWREALSAQAAGAVIGTCWAIFAWWLQPMFFYWSLPVAIPLILAAPTSVILSRTSVGAWLRERRLFCVPEECNGSPLLRDLRDQRWLPARSGISEQAEPGEPALHRALFDPRCNRLHQHFALANRPGLKLDGIRELRARFYAQGPQALNREELTRLLRDRESLAWLHRALWEEGADTLWGRILSQRPRVSED